MIVAQINLQHSKAATAELERRLCGSRYGVVLVQEPYLIKNVISGITNKNYDVIHLASGDKQRTCLVIRRGLKFNLLGKFCSGDLTSAIVAFEEIGGNEVEIVISSAYFPGDSSSPPPGSLVEDLVTFCRANNKQLILGADCNAHHICWGSTNTNDRGVEVFNFLLRNGLEIINIGSEPTFVTSVRAEVLDITVATPFIQRKIKSWKVSKEPSSSDHQYLEFEIESLKPKQQHYRNPRKTDLMLFRENLSKSIQEISTSVNSISDLESCASKLSMALLDSFKKSCPERVKISNSECPWFTPRLQKLRKLARKLWNKSKKKMKIGRFDDPLIRLYRHVISVYNNEVKAAKALSWRMHCEDLEKVGECSRLHKLLSGGPTKALGSIRKPDGSGNFTEKAEETLEVLLSAHFPGSNNFVRPREDFSAVMAEDLPLAGNIVSTERLKWAIDSFSPFKSPGMDGIYPFLLQEGLSVISPLLISLFKASLATGHIPVAWRGVRATFIPKPGKADYTEPKSFRPISLMSFILKTLERLVDRHIRENALVQNPLHKYQFAYQSGKSTEAALHCLVAKLEKSLDEKEFCLAAFLDIEGAFDNTPFSVIIDSAERHGICPSLTRWMYNMLKTREVTASLFDVHVTVTTSRGCPQGGCLSCLMWSLVVNSLLEELNALGGVWAQGFADDLVIRVTGKFPKTVKEIMQNAFKIVEKWCGSTGLSINPNKTTVVPFTRQRKNTNLDPLVIFGSSVAYSSQVKYLGVTLDTGLTWNAHISNLVVKTNRAYWACRRMVGSSWGLKPKMVAWLYTQVILPRITYGAAIWWHKAKQATCMTRLNGLQRMAAIAVTGAMRTTPGAALDVLLNWAPLHLKIEEVALSTAFRLASDGLWVDNYKLSGHTALNRKLRAFERFWRLTDRMIPRFVFDHSFRVIIDERSDIDLEVYQENEHTVTCFTDGSKSEEGTGLGVYIAAFDLELSANVGPDATVFQSEVKAIEVCIRELTFRGLQGKNIRICSDSQAALRALMNNKICSKTVWDCLQVLQCIGQSNWVTLRWVPGHCGIEGNEHADELAKRGISLPITDEVPPVPQCLFKEKIKEDLLKSSQKHWMDLAGQKQAKSLLRGYNNKRSSSLLGLERKEVGIITRLLTGHCCLRRHLAKMNLSNTSICRFCEMADETSEHILCECPALMTKRRRIWGSPLIPVLVLSSNLMHIVRFIRLIRLDSGIVPLHGNSHMNTV
jgi:ribonuclease HI